MLARARKAFRGVIHVFYKHPHVRHELPSRGQTPNGVPTMKTRFLTSLSIALLACGWGSSTQAAYTITLKEVGGNVVATGSGSLNLAALVSVGGLPTWSNMVIPENATLSVGPAYASAGLYAGIPAFPAALGSGGMSLASAGTGSLVGAVGGGYLLVPLGYVSGTALGKSETTFANTSFAALGLTPGQYVWTWGDGATLDSLTVTVGGTLEAVDPFAALELKAAAVLRVGTSLTDKLALAKAYFAVPDTTAGCSVMRAFLQQVNALAGKKMTDAQAADLTSGAMDVMTFEGCQ